MKVKDVVGEKIVQAKAVADRLRATYQHAYDTALTAGKDGVLGLLRVRERFEPNLRSALGGGIQAARHLFDEFNQALAERAVPTFRKAGVTQKRLEEKANGAQKAAAMSRVEQSLSAAKGGDASIKSDAKKNSRVRVVQGEQARAKSKPLSKKSSVRLEEAAMVPGRARSNKSAAKKSVSARMSRIKN